MEALWRSVKQKERVTLITCDGALESCWKNPSGEERTCARCRFWKAGALNGISKYIKTTTVDDLLREGRFDVEQYRRKLEYQTIEDIKELKYRDCWIGWAAFSTYVSQKRTSQPLVNSRFREAFDPFLLHSLRLAVSLDWFLQENSVKKITVFNGRTSDTRPVYDLARAKKIDVRSVEIVRLDDGTFRGQERFNALPQDVRATTDDIERLWNSSLTPIPRRYEIAHDFFDGRRRGLGNRDVQSWVKHQTPGLLPQSWCEESYNIVFFTSSEFEVAGIRELQLDAPFSSQMDAIKEIAKSIQARPACRLTVRVHPNSTNGNDPVDQWLDAIEQQYARVYVEGPGSLICTYALMDAADLVVTSNSTTGIEAAYWGKPVVIAGKAAYEQLDSCYTIRAGEGFSNYLAKRLPGKPVLGCIKYAFWLAEVNQRTHEIPYQTRILSLSRRRVTVGNTAFRLLGSSLLFWIFDLAFFRLLSKPNSLFLTKKRGKSSGRRNEL